MTSIPNPFPPSVSGAPFSRPSFLFLYPYSLCSLGTSAPVVEWLLLGQDLFYGNEWNDFIPSLSHGAECMV